VTTNSRGLRHCSPIPAGSLSRRIYLQG
jgi:hypothetical protein